MSEEEKMRKGEGKKLKVESYKVERKRRGEEERRIAQMAGPTVKKLSGGQF